MTKTVPALVVLLMLCSIVTTNGEVHLQPRESRASTVIKTSTSLPEEPEKLSDNSVIHACAGRDLSLPLIASPSSPYVISEVKWFHESKSPAMIAVAADGHFLSTPAYTGRVEQTTNAGITLTELTSSDAGNYSVEIWVYNGEEDISLWKLSFNVFVAAHCPHDNSGDVDGTVDEAKLHGCKANQEDKIRDLQKTLKDQKSLYTDTKPANPSVDYISPGAWKGCSLMGGRPFEDLCYFHIHKKKTWQDAVANCKNMSSHLVEVHSADVNNFLKSMVRATDYINPGTDTWLGLNDIANEGSFVWESSQAPPSFTDWASGEPNNLHGDEDCAHLFIQVSGRSKWNDMPCNTTMRSVCQRRLNES